MLHVSSPRWLLPAALLLATLAQAQELMVIKGDRIRSVGGQAPAGARVIDLGDVTLLPGLMDMHTHLGYDLSKESFIRAVKETALDEALRTATVYAADLLGVGDRVSPLRACSPTWWRSSAIPWRTSPPWSKSPS